MSVSISSFTGNLIVCRMETYIFSLQEEKKKIIKGITAQQALVVAGIGEHHGSAAPVAAWVNDSEREESEYQVILFIGFRKTSKR